MVCLYCSSSTRVANSRSQRAGTQTWRRRVCVRCKAIFTTRELPDLEHAIRVRGHNNALSSFSRDKLLLSIHASLTHRVSSIADASGLCDTIIEEILQTANRGLLEASSIIRVSIQVLARFDQAATTHYKAHHRP